MVLYKYVAAERIDILQKRLIRFTQPNALNDPFEARLYFHITKEGLAREFANMIRQAPAVVWEDFRQATKTNLGQYAFADKLERDPDYADWLYKGLGLRPPPLNLPERLYELYNHVGILSLSGTPDNLLMWAHYTEGHTGFVLMLDGSHDFFKGGNSSPSVAKGFAKPERVEYRLERPQMAIEDPSREILLIKGSDWKYEKEWRYLKHLKDAEELRANTNAHSVNLFRLPPECIVGVILGCYRSKELENKILRLTTRRSGVWALANPTSRNV